MCVCARVCVYKDVHVVIYIRMSIYVEKSCCITSPSLPAGGRCWEEDTIPVPIPNGVLLTARVDVGIITAEDSREHIGLVSAGHDGGVALSMHHFCQSPHQHTLIIPTCVCVMCR